MNLVLIGHRGSGKSTVGRILAPRLGLDLLDLDEQIAADAGRSIRGIFEDEGESGFRRRERAAVESAVRRDGVIVVAGAGAVMDPVNRQRLRQHGTVVWLSAAVETLQRRIAGDAGSHQTRPPLTDLQPLAELEALLAERAPLYRDLSDFVIETDSLTPQQCADRIAASVRIVPR